MSALRRYLLAVRFTAALSLIPANLRDATVRAWEDEVEHQLNVARARSALAGGGPITLLPPREFRS